MSNIFDIAVIGGGPAGAITALCLARLGWRIGIFESTAFDKNRFGETLPPEINPQLRQLGIWDSFLRQDPLVSPGIVSRWGSDIPAESDYTRNAFGCGWHIDRNRFDRMLCDEAVAAGARLFLNRRMTWVWDGRSWQAEDCRARFLVSATGRYGMPPDGLSARERNQEDALLSIVFQITRYTDHWKDQRTWIESTPAGWWYSAPLPGGKMLAMLFTGAEIYRNQGISIEEQLQHSPMMRQHLGGKNPSPVGIAYAPSGCSKKVFGESWLAVGDSAASYDPLSGYGILKGLRHGELAATAIHSQLNGNSGDMEAYASVVHREFQAYARQRRLYYADERRWSDRPFWQARRSHQV